MRRNLAERRGRAQTRRASPDDDDVIARVHAGKSAQARGQGANIVAGLANWQLWTHPTSPRPSTVSANACGRRGGSAAARSRSSRPRPASRSARCRASSPGSAVPTLELLLPIASAWRVQLDELVGAPPTGDPRIHPRPVNRHGRDVHPVVAAARRAAGVQDPHPATDLDPPASTADPRGYEWLYLLSGRLRLRLGTQDLVLDPGRGGGVRHPHAPRDRGGGREERRDPGPVRSAG